MSMPHDVDEHERGLANFMDPAYRRRYLSLLEANRRERFRSDLPHFKHLDPHTAKRLSLTGKHAEQLESLHRELRAHGAPDVCVVFTGDSDLYGQPIPLHEALEKVTGQGMGAFVSCLPGRVGYFEGEERGTGYVLLRS